MSVKTYAKTMGRIAGEQNKENEKSSRMKYLSSLNINPSYISLVMRNRSVF